MLSHELTIQLRGLHELVVFVPGLVMGAILLRVGRFLQFRSAGGTTSLFSFPPKDPAKLREAALFWKGFGLLLAAHAVEREGL
jgi:hypothetical protein